MAILRSVNLQAMNCCYKHLGKMKRLGHHVLVAIVLGCALLVPEAAAQEDFEVDVLVARSDSDPARSRIDTYTRVPVSKLSFINSINGFTAGYEVKLDITQLSDEGRIRNLVQSKIWQSKMTVDTYAETQMDAEFDVTTQTLETAPGRYIFEYSLTDDNSSQSYYREYDVFVRDLSGPVAVSDITLLESFDDENFTIVPKVGGRVLSNEGGFQVFYEVYADQGKDVVITQQVERARPDAATATSTDELVYSKEDIVTLEKGRTQYLVTMPVTELEVGSYRLAVDVESLDGRPLASVFRRVEVAWSGLYDHIENIDQAIAQLEYIAKKRDLKFIESAPNGVERQQRFTQFWERRDPTPGTSRNERMEEYYYRIAAANRQYSASIMDGWKTDRGFVLVRFGEPDHVQHKPYSFGYEPYEVWVYERIGRQFIFVDETGFGDYQLLVPVWDERTKLY